MKQFWLDTSKMTDGELADLLHELNDELDARLRKIAGNWLNRQLDIAQLKIRSYGSQHQKNMHL